jgi:hypothetical protein
MLTERPFSEMSSSDLISLSEVLFNNLLITCVIIVFYTSLKSVCNFLSRQNEEKWKEKTIQINGNKGTKATREK